MLFKHQISKSPKTVALLILFSFILTNSIAAQTYISSKVSTAKKFSGELPVRSPKHYQMRFWIWGFKLITGISKTAQAQAGSFFSAKISRPKPTMMTITDTERITIFV